MKKVLVSLLGCLAVLCTVFLFIHRRVIRALISGEEMPEPPAWHTWHKQS